MEQIAKKIETLTENWSKFQSQHESEAESLRSKLHALEKRYNNLSVSEYRPTSSSLTLKSHVGEFIRKGNVHPSLVCKADLLAGASDVSSAIVESSMSKKIFGLLKVMSPLRRLASIEEVSSSALEVLVQEKDFECNWVSEEAARPVTEAAKLSKKRILLHQLYAQPKASQALLEDACVDVEGWLIEQLSQSFAKKESESFINGNGVTMPEGLLAPNALGAQGRMGRQRGDLCQSIIELISSLEDRYQANASFLMSRSALLEVQKLRDSQGRFLWQPMLSEAMPETLLGRPVFCSDYMPSFEENNKPIILFGDFKSAYKIVDHTEVTVMRDPFSHKPFISFYAVKRVGGAVLDKKALVYLELESA
jgi:HK97 family phage major capsid protein